jgi:hypothetical protein
VDELHTELESVVLFGTDPVDVVELAKLVHVGCGAVVPGIVCVVQRPRSPDIVAAGLRGLGIPVVPGRWLRPNAGWLIAAPGRRCAGIGVGRVCSRRGVLVLERAGISVRPEARRFSRLVLDPVDGMPAGARTHRLVSAARLAQLRQLHDIQEYSDAVCRRGHRDPGRRARREPAQIFQPGPERPALGLAPRALAGPCVRRCEKPNASVEMEDEARPQQRPGGGARAPIHGCGRAAVAAKAAKREPAGLRLCESLLHDGLHA